MNVPPLVLWLHVERPERSPVRVWLPLFLVWLLLLPLMLLALALTMIADVVLFLVGARYHRYTLLLIGCCQLLAETRGMVIRVNGEDTIVDVTVA